jgi:hypothetical protein
LGCWLHPREELSFLIIDDATQDAGQEILAMRRKRFL